MLAKISWIGFSDSLLALMFNISARFSAIFENHNGFENYLKKNFNNGIGPIFLFSMVWKWQKIKDAYAGRKTPWFRRQSTFEWLDSMSYYHLLLHTIVLMISCLNNLLIPFKKIFTFAK